MILYEERMRAFLAKISSTKVPSPREQTANRAILFLILIFFLAWRFYMYKDRDQDALTSVLFFITGLLIFVSFFVLLTRTKIIVTDTEVAVKRMIGPRTVRTDDIVKVSIEAADVRKGMYEYNAAHPGAKIYASKRMDKGVALELRDGTSLLICSKTPDAFMAAVTLAIGKRNG